MSRLTPPLVVALVACGSPAEQPGPAPAPARDAQVDGVALDRVDDLVVGLDHACALREGRVYCWGHALGLGASSRIARELVALPPIRAIASAGRRVCALGDAGELFCWGELVGERSSGVRGQIYAPGAAELQIVWGGPRRLDFGRPVASVAVGMTHICAITDAGDLYCWGSASGRQLASDTPASAAELVAEQVDAVEVGHGWTCITAVGERTCRGAHPRMTGLYQEDNAQTPGWVMASCGVSAQSEVFCVGTLTLVQAGKPPPAGPGGDRQKIEGLADVRQLALGTRHACVVVADGGVWCWGDDQAGQVSGARGTANQAPRQVALPGPARRVGAGQAHSCALLERGDVACWGTGDAGGAGVPVRFAPRASAGGAPGALAIEPAQRRYRLRARPTPAELGGTSWHVCLSQVGVERPTGLCDVTHAYRLRFEQRRFTAESGPTRWTGTWTRTNDAIRVTEAPAPAGTRWEWSLELRGEELVGDRHVKGSAPMYLAMGHLLAP